MKFKLLIFTLLVLVAGQVVNAYVTVEETTNVRHLKNSGYSELTGETVNISKARATGREYYTEKEAFYRERSPFTRFIWRTYQYFDPAAEDYSFFHHDTKSYPVPNDL